MVKKLAEILSGLYPEPDWCKRREICHSIVLNWRDGFGWGRRRGEGSNLSGRVLLGLTRECGSLSATRPGTYSNDTPQRRVSVMMLAFTVWLAECKLLKFALDNIFKDQSGCAESVWYSRGEAR